jgi:hypothetical protein
MTKDAIKGSCLCGGVCFETALPPVRFHYCYCVSCRKTTSSAQGSLLVFLPESFRWIAGESLIERFTDEHSNPGYMRWFCRRCGCAVPRLSRTKKFILVPAGLLDDDPQIKPQRSIFWDERAPWLLSMDAIPKHAEGPDSVTRETGKEPNQPPQTISGLSPSVSDL